MKLFGFSSNVLLRWCCCDLVVPKHFELHFCFYDTDLKSSQSLNMKLGKLTLSLAKKLKLQQPELKPNPLNSIVSMSNSYLFIDASPRCYTFTVGRNMVFFFFFVSQEQICILGHRACFTQTSGDRECGAEWQLVLFWSALVKRQRRNTQRNDNSCE